MAAFSLKQAFGREKPHSSITDWVDILTAPTTQDEAYDGIPELVDSINLQITGPSEASRALRKKLKHGSPHQQYRAIVILKALVENCGHKFQTSFADGQLTEVLKHLASDSNPNQKVRKKMTQVLASWHAQFKNDPSMALVANLYKPHSRVSTEGTSGEADWEKRRQEREESRLRAKREKEEAQEREKRRREEAAAAKQRAKDKTRKRHAPFDFEKEKPQVLSSIANASQASSNLINAITLVNPEKDSVLTNERVQDCLTMAKTARKQIVRYIQLVENEELIGTLIETNDRIVSALEMYDQLSTPDTGAKSDASEAVRQGLATIDINTSEGEITKLQSKQKAAVERAKLADPGSHVHPDLQDLSFGALGSSSQNLPSPMRPSAGGNEARGGDDRWGGGTLSDYSDYESSDEETHNARASSSKRRDYIDVSDNSDEDTTGVRGDKARKGKPVDIEDPFADPFADEAAVVDSGRRW